MIFDMHTHTNLSSCSEADIYAMINAAGQSGLNGMCITDHQSMEIRNHLKEGPQANNVVVIFGMEYATPEGDFLIFGPYEHIPSNLDGRDLLIYVSDTNGIAIGAHPFRKDRPLEENLVQNGLCTIVEGINGRNTELENLQVDGWRKRYRFTEIGGSDAHTPAEIGKVVTRFSVPIWSRHDLIVALRNGQCKPEHRQHKEPALFS